MSRRQPYDLPKAQEADGAKVFWKSLEDKASPEAAQRRAEQEFLTPPGAAEKLVTLRKKSADEIADGVPLGRRGFMFFAGASAALFAEGCARRPVEKIMPYAKAPEQVLPGVPTHFATVMQYRSDAVGLVVESHEGRPTKVEGNRDHGASLGATDAWAQGAIYDLYDPDRATTPTRLNKNAGPTDPKRLPATWQELESAIGDIVRANTGDGGARLRLLVGPTTSPTFIRLRDAFQTKFPQAKVHVWAPVNESNAREGAKIAFGQAVNVVAAYSQARVIVSLDCDFLGTEPGHVRANREFAETRRVHSPSDPMSRLYAIEPTFSITGMNADHRLRLSAQDVERYALLLAKELADKHAIDLGPIKDAAAKADGGGSSPIPPKWIQVVAKELASARARSVIVAGTRQPPRVHALVHALNAALGNAGHTVNYYPVADLWESDPGASLKLLAADIERGAVGTLFLLGTNPAYDAPGDVKIADKLGKIINTLCFSSHVDETAELCTWHVPRAHELEAWGDQRSLDGTVAIQQPLIAPLHGGKSDLEVLARLAGNVAPKGHDLVQETTKPALSSATTVDRAWKDALRRGVLGPAAKPFGPMDARRTEIASALGSAAPGKSPTPDALEVTFAACPKVFDGRHGNNPLLLELPDPVTKVTWDNVALVSADTAKALGLESRQMVRLSRDGAQPVDTCVWIVPGQAEGSIAVVLGWGRRAAGRYGNRHGFDVNGLRTTEAMWIASGVKLQKLSAAEIDAIRDKYRRIGMASADAVTAAATPFARVRPDDPFDAQTNLYKISQTQEHDTMEGRPVAVDTTLEEYRKNPVYPLYPDDERKDLDQHAQQIPVRKEGTPDPKVPPLWGNWKEEDEKVGFKGHHRWAMGIDLATCTGCNACVIACQVENNVPAVGKEQVWRGREMHWLRIDRYFVGVDPNDPQIAFQPVACVQCEEAPCENVCPVNATEHSPEGLNDMAYNRCIGTRYCANNCPYKVRRFNYLNFHTSGGWYDDVPEIERMHYNPNVTVRMRGVMEKCTYCVQRIQEAKIESKRKGGSLDPIKRIQTACQQACPTNAIVFGDLTDPQARVARWRASGRSYRLLAELGTRPRTTYLGKVRNPNPEMKEGGA
jgi:molybdopterin-containing oxidoreductase family iron-sulfur binding subunit